MASYRAIGGLITTPTVTESLIHVTGGTGGRLKWTEAIMGSQAAPVEQTSEFRGYRSTGTGATGTVETEFQNDPADVAPAGVALSDLTAEPTGKVYGLAFPLHQRGTFRWVANPGEEIIVAATANHAFGMEFTATTSAYVSRCCVGWHE